MALSVLSYPMRIATTLCALWVICCTISPVSANLCNNIYGQYSVISLYGSVTISSLTSPLTLFAGSGGVANINIQCNSCATVVDMPSFSSWPTTNINCGHSYSGSSVSFYATGTAGACPSGVNGLVCTYLGSSAFSVPAAVTFYATFVTWYRTTYASSIVSVGGNGNGNINLAINTALTVNYFSFSQLTNLNGGVSTSCSPSPCSSYTGLVFLDNFPLTVNGNVDTGNINIAQVYIIYGITVLTNPLTANVNGQYVEGNIIAIGYNVALNGALGGSIVANSVVINGALVPFPNCITTETCSYCTSPVPFSSSSSSSTALYSSSSSSSAHSSSSSMQSSTGISSSSSPLHSSSSSSSSSSSVPICFVPTTSSISSTCAVITSLDSNHVINGDVCSSAAFTSGSNSIVNGNIYAVGAITTGAGSLVTGSMSAGGAITTGVSSIVDGNVGAGAAITLGSGAVILGTAVSAINTITYGAGATVGSICIPQFIYTFSSSSSSSSSPQRSSSSSSSYSSSTPSSSSSTSVSSTGNTLGQSSKYSSSSSSSSTGSSSSHLGIICAQ